MSRNQYQAYAAEEVELVRRLVAESLSDRQIHARTGMPAGRVTNIRRRYNIASQVPRVNNLAAYTGQKPYAAEEIAAVRDLAASGLSDPQISAETGISEGRVYRIRKRYGIGSRLRELSADDAAKYDNPLSPEKLAYLRQQVGWREGFDYNADDLRHDRAWRKLVSVAD